jgi:hypothetical protein
MNLFNTFQAMGLYTLTPLGIAWLFQNGYSVAGYIASAILFVGYVVVSLTLHDGLR